MGGPGSGRRKAPRVGGRFAKADPDPPRNLPVGDQGGLSRVSFGALAGPVCPGGRGSHRGSYPRGAGRPRVAGGQPVRGALAWAGAGRGPSPFTTLESVPIRRNTL